MLVLVECGSRVDKMNRLWEEEIVRGLGAAAQAQGPPEQPARLVQARALGVTAAWYRL